jgi:catechol 2,3-dioxygenase-like lactoylglutathione lyase family enzyme
MRVEDTMMEQPPIEIPEDDLLAAVAHVTLDPEAHERAATRRAATRVRRLNHHAFYCKDVLETRHFYEDILELKLVNCMQLEHAPDSGEYFPYAHLFFELSDGSWIAFFDAPLLHDGDEFAPHPFDHHLALTVEHSEDIEYFREKSEKAGYPNFVIDHGFCVSLYLRDPNNMHTELTWIKPLGEDYFLKSEKVAPEALGRWLTRRMTVKRG